MIIKLCRFSDYATLVLQREFPPDISNRYQLANYMIDSATDSANHLEITGDANVIWTDYLWWHISHTRGLPTGKGAAFRRWLRGLDPAELTPDQRATVADIKVDKSFPIGSLDCVVDYMVEDCQATDEALAAVETLWLSFIATNG